MLGPPVGAAIATAPPAGALEAMPEVELPPPLRELPKGRLADLAQTRLLEAVQAMQRVSELLPPTEQAQWREQVEKTQALLRSVQKLSPNEAIPIGSGDLEGALEPGHAQEFGRRIYDARLRAGLTQQELAQLAGLGHKTIRNVEAGAHVPTRSTVMRLLAVKELELGPREVPWRESDATELSASPNCWIAPGYEPLKSFAELFEQLNGAGGSIEQTFAYLDHKSAVSWYQLSNQAQYAATFRANIPLDDIARRIVDEAGTSELDVIALGSGDGRSEVRLTQHLLDHDQRNNAKKATELRLYLLDISQPLLSTAYHHAAQTVAQRGVYVCAIQGNFHHFPQYTQLHYSAERATRRRVVCMLGNTLGNLDNEARFFQHTLVGLAPSDMLLLDIDLLRGVASTDNPEEILRTDPVFRGIQPGHADWLSGPLKRYCNDAVEVTLKPVLDRHAITQASYTIDVLAQVKLRSGEKKQFSIFRFKRYDRNVFPELLRTFQWELLAEVPYGSTDGSPQKVLFLFRKAADPTDATDA